eukprot:CAMPEP_0172406526 /NCGR_PEP_ID=MMETSP1061-20121228/71025_1 /TAXON_ID=37318 /ORGANISM="Pseudo-nitzschia pungens, Strain cf. pungens" /LENGTH=442 /DNA_ID=CAMNT_0013142163 /DNA_START=24 /DNA_END=1352 /DNA_ORIENTATION=+
MSGGGGEGPKKCGLTELIVFSAALVFGTMCSIMSKNMMALRGEGISGETEVFEKPIFQTFGMFLGMLFALPMHYVVMAFKVPFPGYIFEEESSDDEEKGEDSGLLQSRKTEKTTTVTPAWMYFFLAIPAVFDLGATALCMMGLRYIPVSIYQLLRGSGIIFVAVMKQIFLHDKMHSFQWIGIFWNVISVMLVGSTAILSEEEGNDSSENVASGSDGSASVGVVLVLLGAFVQALQYVFEEKVMTMDIPAPPLLLIGMEGLWGTIFCVTVAYPIVYYLPGDDHGSYEDPFNTWYMIKNSTTIQIAFWIYFCSIFFYNFFAVLVTFLLNSVWHAILDNFRPITIWMTDLVIFYYFTPDLGEKWTVFSWVQVFGMIILLYGTAIYNAPNAGSILLEGQWFSFGFNFSREYEAIKEEIMHDEQFESRKLSSRKMSSFRGELAASLR